MQQQQQQWDGRAEEGSEGRKKSEGKEEEASFDLVGMMKKARVDMSEKEDAHKAAAGEKKVSSSSSPLSQQQQQQQQQQGEQDLDFDIVGMMKKARVDMSKKVEEVSKAPPSAQALQSTQQLPAANEAPPPEKKATKNRNSISFQVNDDNDIETDETSQAASVATTAEQSQASKDDDSVAPVKPDCSAAMLTFHRSPTVAPNETLNDGWVKYIDPSSSWPYYYNTSTFTSTYDRPDGFSTVKDPFTIARSLLKREPTKKDLSAGMLSMHRQNTKNKEPEEKLNGGWSKYHDDETGWYYYWNEVSCESTYDRPVGFETIVDPFAVARRDDEEEVKVSQKVKIKAESKRKVMKLKRRGTKEVINANW
jgi:hypothetical protein